MTVFVGETDENELGLTVGAKLLGIKADELVESKEGAEGGMVENPIAMIRILTRTIRILL